MTIRKVLNKYWGWTFLIVPLILQVVFFYFPMFQGAFYSFTNWTGLTYNFDFVGINNYKILNSIGVTFTFLPSTETVLVSTFSSRPPQR